MNIHNGKNTQQCFEPQRTATYTAATYTAAVAGDSNAQQCTATHRAAQRSVMCERALNVAGFSLNSGQTTKAWFSLDSL